MIFARFILAAAVTELAGLSILSRLSRRPRSGPGALGLGFFTGVMGLGLWTCLLLWVRVPVNLVSLLAGAAVLVGIGRWGYRRELVWKRPPWPCALIALGAGFIVWGAVSWPLSGLDPLSMYDVKAKAIVHFGTFWNEIFTDPDRFHVAHRRPILLPVIYVDLYLFLGAPHGRLLNLWFALIQIGALAGMYDTIRQRASRIAAAIGVMLFAWLPALWHDAGGAISAYGDAPFGMLVLFALGSETPLGVLFLCAISQMKEEGAAFVIAFALGRWVLKPALLPGLLAAAWLLISSRLPLDFENNTQRFLELHPSSIPLIVSRFVSHLSSLKHWSFLTVISGAALILRARTFDREDRRWLLPLVLQWGSYAAIMMTFPPLVLANVIKFQVMRLLLHLVPALWVWVVWTLDRHPSPAGSATSPTPAPSLPAG